MRSLTQVRRLQLENGWTVTAPNGHTVGYVPSHTHDSHPFHTDVPGDTRYSAKQLTAVPPAERPLAIALTMWRHAPMYHVVIAGGIAPCGRDEMESTDLGVSDLPSDRVCPPCRPYTGIAYVPRPERRWIDVPGHEGQHILTGERSTACALYCTPEDHRKIAAYPVTADSDLGDDVPRCEVCVNNQDANDLRDAWRYL